VKRALLLAACLISCAKPPEQPILGNVPSFELVDQNGARFSSTQLAGKVWIADFIFTTCPGPCLRMSAKMRAIQDAFSGDPGVRLVSFTVDPDRDSPPVLTAYAKRYLARPEQWHFLTGPKPELNRLSRDAFQIGDIVGDLNHSTKLFVVDRQMRITAYISSDEPDAVARVIAAVRAAQGR
jgi:protein SCO1/2